MPKLINTTDRPISASTGHAVPPKGSLAISQAALGRIAAEPYIARVIRQGALLVEQDATQGPVPEITREAIAKMKRADLIDVILAHYDDSLTKEDFDGVTVDDKDGEDGLRTIATRLVFVDA